ncbi:MAG: glycerol-3-phosphate acyltransferase [Chloroflexi bacterium]|nr:glycerol-3-phosphate acyltransferase [Chloroflexota bacterium]
MTWLRYAGCLLAAYLLGSVPVGYLIVRLVKGVDITRVGSGRIGGTNVLRVAGALPAALTVLADLAKGYGAVAVARALAPGMPLLAALAGLCAVLGHAWSLFLRFGGGVGTMTAGGAALALAPLATTPAGLLAIVVVAASRYSSLGSLTFAVGFALICLAYAVSGHGPAAHVLFALIAAAVAIWKLRPNIARLRQGTERRIGQTVAPGQTDVKP